MRSISYVTLFFAPAVGIFIYFYQAKRNDKKFLPLLIKSFVAGIIGIVLLLLIEYLAMILKLNDLRSLYRTLFYSFAIIGFGSELSKFIVFRYYIMRRKEGIRPIQAITFSVMTSMGFSSIALLLFFFLFYDVRMQYPYTLYTFIFVPANLIFAVIMGFFVGMAKYIKSTVIFPLIGLFGAAFFNGLYNFCLITHDFKLLSLFSFFATIIILVLIIKAYTTKPELPI